MNTEGNHPVHDAVESSALDACRQLASQMEDDMLQRHYGNDAKAKRAKLDKNNPLNMLLKMALSPSLQRMFDNPISVGDYFGTDACASQPHTLLEMDDLVQKAFQTFGRDFPTAIWTCCAGRCFARVSILPEHSAVFNAVLKIGNSAEAFHEKIEGVGSLLRTRKRGQGRSSLTFAKKRTPHPSTIPNTDRKVAERALKKYVARVLPYLRAEIADADGTRPPRQPFCYQAITQILGVQRNFLFKPTGDENGVIDQAGVRQRRFRRIGSRKGFEAISGLSSFQCGCDVPCFTGLDDEVLQRLWEGFKAIAGQLSPEEKEHRYLMNQMFCPLTNTSVRVCNRAIAQLYTLSEPLVASIRLLIHQMCEDPAIEELPVREHGMKRYRAHHHPLNRFPKEIIEHVERHLDMLLRPDPAAADGINVCRVYSPEINTQEKLRRLIAETIDAEFEEVPISPTSLQQMVKAYLDRRGYRISFSQADHNACPMCKSYHCELLYLHYEKKKLSQTVSEYLPIVARQKKNKNVSTRTLLLS